MPVWGLGLALIALVAAVAVAVPAALSQPERSSAQPRPLPSMFVPEKKPVAAFIGDSYTAGAGSTDGGFVKLVAAEQGWLAKNLGRGGTGFITREDLDPDLARRGCGKDYCESFVEMIDAAAKLQPAVVVVSGGRNNVNDDPDVTRAAIDEFFTKLRAQLPDTRVVVTSPLWDSREAPERISEMSEWERAAAESAGAEYLDLGQPLEGQAGFLAADGIHPNDAGHEAIAEAITAQLAE